MNLRTERGRQLEKNIINKINEQENTNFIPDNSGFGYFKIYLKIFFFLIIH